MNTRRLSARTCRACAAGADRRGILFRNWQTSRRASTCSGSLRLLGRDGEAGAGASRRQRWGPASGRTHQAAPVGTSEPVSQDPPELTKRIPCGPEGRRLSPEWLRRRNRGPEAVRTRVGFPPPPPIPQGQRLPVGFFLVVSFELARGSWGCPRTSPIGLWTGSGRGFALLARFSLRVGQVPTGEVRKRPEPGPCKNNRVRVDGSAVGYDHLPGGNSALAENPCRPMVCANPCGRYGRWLSCHHRPNVPQCVRLARRAVQRLAERPAPVHASGDWRQRSRRETFPCHRGQVCGSPPSLARGACSVSSAAAFPSRRSNAGGRWFKFVFRCRCTIWPARILSARRSRRALTQCVILLHQIGWHTPSDIRKLMLAFLSLQEKRGRWLLTNSGKGRKPTLVKWFPTFMMGIEFVS